MHVCPSSHARTYTQRTETKLRPALYQGPVPLTTSMSRRPPPYQTTFSRARRPGHQLLLARPFGPLDAGLALARVGRRRFVQVGVGVKLADLETTHFYDVRIFTQEVMTVSSTLVQTAIGES
jgi:hypothetical protein